MGIEIERKFLLQNDSWKTPDLKGIHIKQGYIANSPEAVVRVRVSGDSGFLTVKGKTTGATRLEFEYNIPLQDAIEMLDLCRHKQRVSNTSKEVAAESNDKKIAVDGHGIVADYAAKLTAPAIIEKIRYMVNFKGFEWSIDIFSGSNQGLAVAEIELEHEEQQFEYPPWAGKEVTGDPRYYNSNLICYPFSSWKR
ncbi:conserved hypothetical protein [Desulfamplus magnetovallimortis]|uniref:CYTH domain-containing protein n=1 Tax=Desulfamplus magnetovallimortis TaxID=1246637 RepID=A0A1W1H9I6_9BACT|nr:CYTH domain-containing protein [Desulfamplus magnetovallimortis]SLM29104.1 conserved hypothetical protein [Desulfamplus magnetovallimortis]